RSSSCAIARLALIRLTTTHMTPIARCVALIGRLSVHCHRPADNRRGRQRPTAADNLRLMRERMLVGVVGGWVALSLAMGARAIAAAPAAAEPPVVAGYHRLRDDTRT